MGAMRGEPLHGHDRALHAPAVRPRPHPADLRARAHLHRPDVAQCDQRNRNRPDLARALPVLGLQLPDGQSGGLLRAAFPRGAGEGGKAPRIPAWLRARGAQHGRHRLADAGHDARRAAWERECPGDGRKALQRAARRTSLDHRSLIFDANPQLKRVVFICTPHRGSEMAIGTIGELGMRLIALPATSRPAITEVGRRACAPSPAKPQRLPNSVTSLSPKNPTSKVMDQAPIHAPHHTILGDRGKGDSPNSSDGVVPYWSSHLDPRPVGTDRPGPHGSCELPRNNRRAEAHPPSSSPDRW